MHCNNIGIVLNMISKLLFMMVLDLGIAGATFVDVLAKRGVWFFVVMSNDIYILYKWNYG